MRRSKSRFVLVSLLTMLVSLPPFASAGSQTPLTAPSAAGFLFVENVGQFDPRARFQVRGGPGTLWLAEDALWLTLVEQRQTGPRRAVNVRLGFAGANPHPRLEPFDRQNTVIHYYRGSDPAQWHTSVPVWGGVRYHDLYPGIDLVVGAAPGQPPGSPLPWRLEVRDGADLSAVRLRVEGAESAALDGGRLRLSTSLGQVSIPLLSGAFQAPASTPSTIRTGRERFEITSPYAPAAPDGPAAPQMNYPEEAYFGSYLGGSGTDWGYDVAVSGQGDILNRDYEFSSGESRSIWVVGRTTSSNFPTTSGSTQLHGASDAFITRMKRTATQVAPVYSAYIGGSGEDAAHGIALDAAGNAYVTGWTTSNDFATTSNAFDRTYNGCSDIFVVKVAGDGTLLYATYLGGSHITVPGLGDICGNDEGAAIAVSAENVVYLTGYTQSQDFPTTSGAYDTVFSNSAIGLNDDTFVVKLDLSQGTSGLLYSTFIGGGTISRGQDIAVDGSGNAYVTGYSQSGPKGGIHYFPTTPNAYSTAGEVDRGAFEVYVLKLNPGGHGSADLLYSTYLGATGGEQGYGIALDAGNHVYVCGYTESPDFPTTSGAFDTTCGNDGNCDSRRDFFVSKLNLGSNGSADLLYSTFLGGSSWEGYQGDGDLALGSDGDVYITGDTSSTTGFPITTDAYDQTGDSSRGDTFVVRLRLQGNGAGDLIYGSYVGGSYGESGRAIALDEDDRVYVTGDTDSPNFPTTAHAAYTFYYGQGEAYLFRLLAPPSPNLTPSTKTVAPSEAAAGQVVTFTVRLVNSGVISASATFTDTLPAALLLQGSPVASSGLAPAVNGQTITWAGTVMENATVLITYTTLLTSTTAITPTAFNQALIDDGQGNVYQRRAYVNGHHLFLPLVLKG